MMMRRDEKGRRYVRIFDHTEGFIGNYAGKIKNWNIYQTNACRMLNVGIEKPKSISGIKQNTLAYTVKDQKQKTNHLSQLNENLKKRRLWKERERGVQRERYP